MSIKNIFSVISIGILVLTSSVCSQVKSEKAPLVNENSIEMNKKCGQNSDNQYDRVEMLGKLGKILNETMINYYNAKYSTKKMPAKNPRFVNNERPIGFSVFDLTDISNKGLPLGNCIEFKDNHVYHFSLIHIPYSFSHIAILEGGNLKVFKAINCKDGDSLENVINYLNQKLEDDKDKDEILNRIRDYRNYGVYHTVDDDSLRCQSL